MQGYFWLCDWLSLCCLVPWINQLASVCGTIFFNNQFQINWSIEWFIFNYGIAFKLTQVLCWKVVSSNRTASPDHKIQLVNGR